MFEVVLSIVGVGFAAWALLGPASKEQIRARGEGKAGILRVVGSTILALTLLYPFAVAAIPAACPALRDLALAIGQVLTVVLVALAASTVWPSGRWDEGEIRSLHKRVESLILTGRAGAVVDALNQAFPSLPRRRIVQDDESATTPSAYETCFDEVLEDALVHVEFIRAAARHNRPLLAKMLSLQSDAGMFASDEILAELMFGPDRLLPRELAATTNEMGDEQHQFRIPERCTILHALLDDIIVADQIACWKPIGDGVLAHIASCSESAAADPDQRPFVVEYSKARWTSPVGAGLWFFRLMATSATKQGHTWHMWLPYLAHFIEKIDRIVEIPEGSATDEFPNRYCYWIYDCLDCCANVVRMVPRLAPGNPNRPSDRPENDHSVVAGALYTYGRCLASIVKSSRLPDRLKAARVGQLCLDYSEWEGSHYPDEMADFVVKHLTRGVSGEERTGIADYVQREVRLHLHRDSYARLFEKLTEGEGAK